MTRPFHRLLCEATSDSSLSEGKSSSARWNGGEYLKMDLQEHILNMAYEFSCLMLGIMEACVSERHGPVTGYGNHIMKHFNRPATSPFS